MHKLIILAAASSAIALSGCAGLPGTGGAGNAAWADAALKIAQDPACNHTDILDVMLGPVPSGHVHLERSNCHAPAAPPPLTVGTVVTTDVPPPTH